MKMSKKKAVTVIAAAVGVICVLTASFFGTRAYLTDAERATNVLTVGTNTIPPPEDSFTPPALKPVTEYNKAVIVRNTGDTDAFVRVTVKFSDADIRKISGISPDGKTYYSAEETGRPVDAADAVKAGVNAGAFIDHLPDGWVYVKESDAAVVSYTDPYYTAHATRGELLGGYFYYTKPVAPGQSTAYLTKKFITYFESDDAVRPYDVIVYAESMQTEDYLARPFKNWEAAWTAQMSRKPEYKTAEGGK